MKITQNFSQERKIKIYNLYFIKKMKQRDIAKRLWIAVRTVQRYLKKVKD